MENPNTEDLQEKFTSDEKKIDSLTDELLIQKVQQGDVDLFRVLVKRYNQQLFRIVRGYLSNRQDCEDVLQTTYLKGFKNLNQFRGEAKFSTWLIRIAINEALKKKKGRNKVSDLHSVTKSRNRNQNSNVEHHTPESTAIRKDMNTHLEKAIDALPSKYRSVLIMREIEQLSTEETSEILDISQSNVKVRLHRAKNMLRDELTEMLDEMDLFSFRGEDCDRLTQRVMSQIKRRS